MLKHNVWNKCYKINKYSKWLSWIFLFLRPLNYKRKKTLLEIFFAGKKYFKRFEHGSLSNYMVKQKLLAFFFSFCFCLFICFAVCVLKTEHFHSNLIIRQKTLHSIFLAICLSTWWNVLLPLVILIADWKRTLSYDAYLKKKSVLRYYAYIIKYYNCVYKNFEKGTNIFNHNLHGIISSTHPI